MNIGPGNSDGGNTHILIFRVHVWAVPGKVRGNRIYPWKEELDKKFGVSRDIGINSQSQCNQGLEWGGQNASGWRGKLDKTICKSFFVLPYSQHIYQGIITSPPIFYTHIYTNN